MVSQSGGNSAKHMLYQMIIKTRKVGSTPWRICCAFKGKFNEIFVFCICTQPCAVTLKIDDVVLLAG